MPYSKKKKPQCSFHSERKTNALSKSELSGLEEAIMREYRKLAYSQETVQYETESLNYIDISKDFPPHIKKHFKHGVSLENFTFYEMFTILIFEHLYTTLNQRKINNLKQLIYSEGFLEGNYFTKGLIIKGFKDVESGKGEGPIGQCLLKTDSVVAFSECWRELVAKICIENEIPIMGDEEIDSSIFDLLASYFKINFDVYWKEGSKFSKERFAFTSDEDASPERAATLAIIVNPTNQISVSQRSIRVTESRISGKSSIMVSDKSENAWNYIILLNEVQRREMGLEEMVCMTDEKELDRLVENQEISRISEVESSYGETEEIKNLLENKILETAASKECHRFPAEVSSSILNLAQTMEKGNRLIEMMREYGEFLSSVKA